MILLKSAREIQLLKDAGKISANALLVAGEHCKPGVTTKEIDMAVNKYIVAQGATPSFLDYNGFPASACISINNQVIHGIPNSKTVLKEGDIVSVDVGAFYKGYHGDNAYTFAVGEIAQEDKLLLETTEKALYAGIEKAVLGNRLGDIGYAVETIARSKGLGVVKSFVGHGVGKNLHEEPEVPNYGKAGHGVRLMKNMVIAIEPMINTKGDEVEVLPDGWTVLTKSGKNSAHFEHTVAITNNGPLILTRP